MENSTNTPNFPPESLSNLSNYAVKSDLPLIIASDTNSHNLIWGDKKTDVRGETLLDTLNTLDLHWANKGKKPTFVNWRGHSSIIDLTIGNKKGLEIVHNWQVSNKVTNSDHKYITYTEQTQNKNATIKNRSIRNTDWEKYRESVKSSYALNKIIDMDIKDETTLNKAVEMFHRMIMHAYEESCSYTYTTSNLRKPPWMTKELIEAKIANQRKLTKARRSKSKAEWKEYHDNLKEYKKLITKTKTKGWKSFCQEAENISEITRTYKILKTLNTTQLN